MKTYIHFLSSHSILKMKNVSEKHHRENQHTHFFSISFFFRNSCSLWDLQENIVQPHWPQKAILHMRIARWIPKNTNTLRICTTETMDAQMLLIVTLHINCLSCLVSNLDCSVFLTVSSSFETCKTFLYHTVHFTKLWVTFASVLSITWKPSFLLLKAGDKLLTRHLNHGCPTCSPRIPQYFLYRNLINIPQ